MNDSTKGAAAVLDRSDAEAMLIRTATAAFTYYPGKEAEEPGYTISEDVDWVMELVTGLDPDQVATWRQRVAEVIENQAAERRTFIADLMALTDD